MLEDFGWPGKLRNECNRFGLERLIEPLMTVRVQANYRHDHYRNHCSVLLRRHHLMVVSFTSHHVHTSIIYVVIIISISSRSSRSINSNMQLTMWMRESQ